MSETKSQTQPCDGKCKPQDCLVFKQINGDGIFLCAPHRLIIFQKGLSRTVFTPSDIEQVIVSLSTKQIKIVGKDQIRYTVTPGTLPYESLCVLMKCISDDDIMR